MLIDPKGKIHPGNAEPGSLKADVSNNVEVVQVSRPRAGSWRVSVVGSNVPHDPQDYALVILGHTS